MISDFLLKYRLHAENLRLIIRQRAAAHNTTLEQQV